MKKVILFFAFLLLASNINFAQSLIGAYDFPYNNIYNGFWGVTSKNDTLWVGTDYDNSANYPYSKLYKITKTAQFIDSLTTPFKFNHGLAWDGSGFWIAQNYTSSGAKIYKINLDGVKIDSLVTGSYASGIGGIALDGNNIWFAVYYPDNTSYPYAYAYKMNLSTKTLVDTIPLRGRQVQGIAVKGDTIFYVTDNMQGDQERIYAFRKAIGDTLFSFSAPDPDNDCDPHGLYWDGQYLWLIAYRVGSASYAYRTLYKYELNGQGTPIISTSPTTIDFGDVPIGGSSNQNLQVNNTGTAKLIITGKNMTNPRFSILPSSVPDTINPGQSKNYTVTFSPLAYDTVSGNLVIVNNDMVNPNKTVLLKGKGVYSGPNIALSDSTYNYNARRNGSLCGWNFKIINTGTSSLNISNISFTNSAYRLDTVGLPFPINISVQEIKSLRIWFHPTGASSNPCTVTITSNALNAPSKTITLAGSTNTNPTTLGEIYWEGNTLDNPFTSYDDYATISIKQIGDVNNDGVNDVVVASANYLTTCFNGNSSGTADSLWCFNTGYNNNNSGSVTSEDAMQIRSDVDGDGIQDVVIGCAGGNEMVYTISGRTGKQIWAWGDSTTSYNGDIEGIRIDRDYNNDGVNDVLISSSGAGQGAGRHAVICLNGLTGAQIFYTTLNPDFTGDVLGTPFGGVIGTGYNNGPYFVQGFDNIGSITWNYPSNGKVWNLMEIPSISTDTVKEIIASDGFSGEVLCLTENNGTLNWSVNVGSTNNTNILLLDDLDSNGFLDFTLSGPTTVYRIDSKTHNVLWENSLASSYIRGIDYLSDVNGDGIRDIVVSTQNTGKVLVLNGSNGNILFTYVWGSGIAYRGDRCAALNSIDGNSTSEFVAGCWDSRIVCFSGGLNTPIGIHNISGVVPGKYNLEQNFPNPFNPVTKIKFDIPKVGNASQNINVTLKVFDVTGREIKMLVNSRLQTGSYEYTFEATNLASGVYFYKLTAGDFSSVKRMVLVR